MSDVLIQTRTGGALYLTLSRPRRRNAMSFAMVDALIAALESVRADRSVRAIVLRGAEGNFCSGGDIKDMAAIRGDAPGPDGRDPIAVGNRRFGSMLQAFEDAPQPVIAVCEGAVMGGGFGLACVADITFAVQGARFRLPETGLGLTPAQVMPFIVRRIGLTQARRLAVTGADLSADQAAAIGLAHASITAEEIDDQVAKTLADIQRGGPEAVAATKALALSVGTMPLDALLDAAADGFAAASRGEEAMAGLMAFISKTEPPWVSR
ncbi:MAG: enoyl-CoA hydratase/isomerase family protein [Myxococcota bacterium]|nr:enoyl-CoA hydratase/isomerase family protein [Myxococcota bacterium]